MEIKREKLTKGRYRFTVPTSEGPAICHATKRGKAYTLTVGARWYGVAPTLADAEARFRALAERFETAKINGGK